MSGSHKPLVWLGDKVISPPFGADARIEAGTLLRYLQADRHLSMPHSRPMPSIGPRCHELRIRDETANWRLIYRIDEDAILILDVFRKKTRRTPERIIATCRSRARRYDLDRE